MSLTLIKVWPEELVQFKDEDGQEIRVMAIRNKHDKAGVAISLGDGGPDRGKYFRKLNERWQSQDSSYNWADIQSFEGSTLISWLEGLESAWMNALMMS